jgi:Putative Ig domain/Protein of unknown function (DUF1565)
LSIDHKNLHRGNRKRYDHVQSQSAESKVTRRSRRFAFLIILTIFLGTVIQSGCAGVASANSSSDAKATRHAALAVSLSPTSLTFPSQQIGTISTSHSVAFTNSGQTTLTFNGNFLISGDFVFGGTGTCGPSLAAGASCLITVKFTPTALGTRTGTVTLNDNAPDSPQTILLTGTGISSGLTALNISTTSLPSGAVGQAYSASLSATGGNTPYTWSLGSGDLPEGLSLSSSGAISGTPTTAGSSTFSTVVTDPGQQSAQKSFSISIANPSGSCEATGGGVCRYVSPIGSDSNPGTSAAPFRTIQKAADVVNPGDVVIVADGIYSNSAASGVGSTLVNITRGGAPGNPVTFQSQNLHGAVLDGLSNTTAEGIEFGANNVTVRGFEVRGFSDLGIGNDRGGQFADIARNLIHDIGRYCTDTAIGKVGIFLSIDNVTVEQNSIYNIGRYSTGENGCSNSTTYYQSNDHGIYIDGASNVIVRNNLFWNNVHGWSLQVYNRPVSNLLIANNTFAIQNPWRPGFIIFANPPTVPVTNALVENNIFYQPNTAAIYLDSYGVPSGWSVTVSHNLTTAGHTLEFYNGSTVVYDAAPSWVFSANMVNANPDFVSTASSPYNFHLTSGSPAIGAGLILPDVTNDYDGVTRGAGNDLGAYKFNP